MTDEVREFHMAMGLPAPVGPTLPRQTLADMAVLEELARELANIADSLHGCAAVADDGTYILRMQLMVEELGEVADALAKGNVRHILQELSDCQYVLDGTYVTFGLGAWKDDAFKEVHRANMSKLDDDGNPVLSDGGRVVKGPNYHRPRMEKVYP